jgi:hypothetical protein
VLLAVTSQNTDLTVLHILFGENEKMFSGHLINNWIGHCFVYLGLSSYHEGRQTFLMLHWDEHASTCKISPSQGSTWINYLQYIDTLFFYQ